MHPQFVGEVSGVDLAGTLAPQTVQALNDAIDRYAVLVFHDQDITDERPPPLRRMEIGRSAARGGRRRLKFPEIGDISNLDEDSRLRRRDDQRRLDSLGNRLWHTDASYHAGAGACWRCCSRWRCRQPRRSVAARPSSPICAPPTTLCRRRSKREIDGLVAEHDIFWSRGQIGFTEFAPGAASNTRRRASALVRRHPGTGRKTLYLVAHASHIVGWPVPRGGSCCAISPSTRPSASSSTATTGGSAIS